MLTTPIPDAWHWILRRRTIVHYNNYFIRMAGQEFVALCTALRTKRNMPSFGLTAKPVGWLKSIALYVRTASS
jgi:hypothetical protein